MSRCMRTPETAVVEQAFVTQVLGAMSHVCQSVRLYDGHVQHFSHLNRLPHTYRHDAYPVTGCQ